MIKTSVYGSTDHLEDARRPAAALPALEGAVDQGTRGVLREPGGPGALTGDQRGDILDARERLIESRQTHLDNLGTKLEEQRVRRVIEPVLSGWSMHDASGIRPAPGRRYRAVEPAIGGLTSRDPR